MDSQQAAEIVFIIAPPRSYTSVVSGILGRHPQLYGVPELQLFVAQSMGEWLYLCSQATYGMDHGLLRVIAELRFGEQSQHTVKLARGWLRRRSHFTTGRMVEELADWVAPRILVDKSPNIVYQLSSLERAFQMFPKARFLHLLRHPRGHGESVIKYLHYIQKHRKKQNLRPLPLSHWLYQLAYYPDGPARGRKDPAQPRNRMDPQLAWLALNRNICTFLESVPEEQKFQIRAEDLLNDLDGGLRRIGDWLRLRTDSEALEEMRHPEASPYARPGPAGARYGNDLLYLANPALRPGKVRAHSLQGPVSWRGDGRGLRPEVKELARRFGYR